MVKTSSPSKLFPWSEIEQPASTHRERLRAEVYSERADFLYLKERWVPTCPLCGRPLVDGFHMHETIVTRGDVPKRHWQDLIFHRYNVSLLCPKCHHHKGHSSAAETLLIEQLVEQYGRQEIQDWLKSLPFKAERSL